MKRILANTLLLVATGISAQTTISDSIFIGNIYRQYNLYIPAVYNGSVAVPLVFNLHGYGSDNVAQEIYGDFRPIADTANFILVHANGTYDGGSNRYWNCWSLPGNPPDEVQFLNALIDSVTLNYNINQDRIYSTGLSNGAFMSNDLACLLSSRITAVACVAGGFALIHEPYCNPAHPMPVLVIHGTSDLIVPYNGATGVMHVDSLVKYWVDENGCNPVPVQTQVPNTVTTDNCTADHFLYSGGLSGSTVELFRVNNGGHTWPGSFPVITLGNTCLDFKASEEIWRFFSQYSLSSLIGMEEATENISISFYPNPATTSLQIHSDNKIFRAVMVDMMGRIVLDKECGAATMLIDISSLSNGVYSLLFYTENGLGIERVLILR
ncbi:MAG TPA: T9SS type A sorting domain-containing protein [Bacteroidia bacterium]|nr:T9SS type A sorting domain-containing protein [Bacteroidia bacterium]